jgi:hypothetical protein
MKNARFQAEKIIESMLRGMPPAIQTSWSITASKETPLGIPPGNSSGVGNTCAPWWLGGMTHYVFLLQTDFLTFWFVLHFTDLV